MEKYMKNPTDTWNRMVKFIRETKNDKLKEIAQMLLRQRNTAGGKMIENELVSFLDRYQPIKH